MKKLKDLRDGSWASLAVAGCIIALFFLIVSHFGLVLGGAKKFLGYFSTVFIGIILAYLVNSPACFFDRKVFKNIKSEKKRWMLSVVVALLLVLLFVFLSVYILIPQLAQSISMFVSNLSAYQEALHNALVSLGLDKYLHTDYSFNTHDVFESVIAYVVDNSEKIISQSAAAGKGAFNFVIAFILCIYFLAEKSNVAAACKHFLATILPKKSCDGTLSFLSRCNVILSQYVVYNIIDALIIGAANVVFMIVTGMPYIGLVSFVVGVTNLIPSFGPIIGLVIGGFVLILADPMHLLLFVIFTLILQTCDGYVIKPKLFGNSLGVSGMLIIVGVIVGGKVAGVAGILLATPVVAIIDFTMKELIMPRLEKRRAEKDKEAA